MKNKPAVFFLISFSVLLISIFDSYAESKGKIMSIDSMGYVYIDLGRDDDIKEGDLVDIYEGSKKILALSVRAVYESQSRLEPPRRRDLDKLKAGLMAVVRLEKPVEDEGVIEKLWHGVKEHISGQIKSIYSQYDIDGNKSQSFYTTGENYQEELELSWEDNLNNDLQMQGLMNARWTDDTYIDPERFSIEELYLQVKNEKFSARAGDILADFTEYSLRASFKGIESKTCAANTFGEGFIDGLFGIKKAQWEDLWSETDRESYSRYVSGLRFAQDFCGGSKIGFNFVSTNDDDGGSTSSGEAPQDNKLVTVDMEIEPLDNFTIMTELGTSFTKFDESRADEEFKNDTVFNVKTDFDIKEWHFDNDYERAGTNFRSLSGVVSSDLEEHSHGVEYKPSDIFSTGFGYRHFRDNLKGHSSRTTFTDVYESDLSANPLSRLPDFNISIGFDMRKRISSDAFIDDEAVTHNIDFANITGPYNYGFSYSLVRKSDDVDLTAGRKKDIWDVFLKSEYEFGDIIISPNASYSREKDKQRLTKDIDTFQSIGGGFCLSIGSRTDFALNWTYSDKDYKAAGRDDIHSLIDFNFQRKLSDDGNRIVEASFKQDDFVREDETVSFTENIFKFSYTQKF